MKSLQELDQFSKEPLSCLGTEPLSFQEMLKELGLINSEKTWFGGESTAAHQYL